MFKIPVNGKKVQSNKPTNSTKTSLPAGSVPFSKMKMILHPSYEAKMGQEPMPTVQATRKALNSAPSLEENPEAQAHLKMLDEQMKQGKIS